MSLTKVSFSMIDGEVINVLDYGASPSATAAANTVAINDAISAAVAAGGGTVYIPAGIYLTDGPIVVKTDVNLVGEGGYITSIKKTGNYAAVSAGSISPSVGCRTFQVVGIGVDSDNFGGNGFDFQDCAYFYIHDIEVTKDAGKGISIQNSFIGNVGSMNSTRCDWNYYFRGVQSVEFNYLYGSLPNNGSNNIGCEIDQCKTVIFNHLVTEGSGKYGLFIRPNTINVVIQQWYFETGTYTADGYINALRINGATIANQIRNFQIKSATLNTAGFDIASPLISVTNSVNNLVLENFTFSLNGTADFSATPIAQFNINLANDDIAGPRISNWTTVDATTGDPSTTWFVHFVANTPDARVFNTITTKTNEYNQYQATRVLPDTNAFQIAGSPITAGLVPKWIGDFCQDTVASRMYIGNTTTAGDWTLI
jgi:hypothetical protein